MAFSSVESATLCGVVCFLALLCVVRSDEVVADESSDVFHTGGKYV